MKVLIFAYNTDRTLFHPVISGCNLSLLTRKSIFGKDVWDHFITTLPYHKVFYYKKDFKRAHPELDNIALPCIFIKQDDNMDVLLEASELNILSDTDELIGLIAKKLSGF